MSARLVFGLIPLLSWPACSLGSVTVQASVSGVQNGEAITFTATTDETDTVVGVTFSYEGTATTDQDTSYPYQVTKTMDWTNAEDLTVTATFDFQNIPDQQGTVDVDVVDLRLIGPTQPTRGSAAGYFAQTLPNDLSVTSWNWTFGSSATDANWVDTANNDDRSVWSGTMAASGSIEVAATLLGVECTKALAVTVASRSGGAWQTPCACTEDNDPNWGSPLLGLGEALGQARDKDSNLSRVIVPQTAVEDWSDGVTLSAITSGPNKGVWYVRSTTLEIDWETVINRYIKSGGPPPETGADNFYDYNDDANGCIADDMADFVQAVKNHEYRGTPSTQQSLEGHFGRIEYALVHEVEDPRAAIEDHVAASESALETSINDTVGLIEDDLWLFTSDACDDWAAAGPNWGGTGALGSGKHTRYDVDQSEYYSGCTFGPDHF